jgi:hypothetical protein
MRLPITLPLLGIVAVIATGLGLLASALHGVARIDTSLQVAAARSAPDRALVQEARFDGDCPYRERRDRV